MEDAAQYSCEALEMAGAFTVEVLRRSDDKLLLSIDSPTWDFYFELASPGAVGELTAFLRRYTGRTEFAELVIGSFSGASVQIVKCPEFEDRLILRALGDSTLVYFKMVGTATQDFVSAVYQAAEELGTEA